MNFIKILSAIVKNHNTFYSNNKEIKIELLDGGDILIVGCEYNMGFIIPLLESLKYHTITMYSVQDANTIKVW